MNIHFWNERDKQKYLEEFEKTKQKAALKKEQGEFDTKKEYENYRINKRTEFIQDEVKKRGEKQTLIFMLKSRQEILKDFVNEKECDWIADEINAKINLFLELYPQYKDTIDNYLLLL